MRTYVSAFMVLISILGWRASMPQSDAPKVIAEFTGSSLKWIHAAEPEFQRKNLDLDKYTIIVAEQNDSVTVGLKSPDSVPGARGSTGRYPGYEVEIGKENMKILHSNYVR